MLVAPRFAELAGDDPVTVVRIVNGPVGEAMAVQDRFDCVPGYGTELQPVGGVRRLGAIHGQRMFQYGADPPLSEQAAYGQLPGATEAVSLGKSTSRYSVPFQAPVKNGPGADGLVSFMLSTDR